MKSIQLHTTDKFELKGYRFSGIGKIKAKLIVAGATGVPQGFYRRFAEFASEQGFDTLTFDYRGIGESKAGSLKGFKMNLLDWGRKDLAAAVEYMESGELPLFMIGHSYGGHAFGLLPNHQKVAGFYVYGTGAGWHGYMPWPEQIKVLFMWNTILPMITRWKGYCAWSALGMGEDLPKDVFYQWRRWCRYPRYFFDDPKMDGIDKLYESVRTPMVTANAMDDRWAMPASRDAFVQYYKNAPLSKLDIPATMIPGGIGHMGYFRKNAIPLWQGSLDWFSELISEQMVA